MYRQYTCAEIRVPPCIRTCLNVLGARTVMRLGRMTTAGFRSDLVSVFQATGTLVVIRKFFYSIADIGNCCPADEFSRSVQDTTSMIFIANIHSNCYGVYGRITFIYGSVAGVDKIYFYLSRSI